LPNHGNGGGEKGESFSLRSGPPAGTIRKQARLFGANGGMQGAIFSGMERPGQRFLIKRLAVAAACSVVILLTLWLPLLAYVHCDGKKMKEWKAVAANWVTGEESRNLMRYHGAAVLKITQDRVYIWRESRWIPVRKRTPG